MIKICLAVIFFFTALFAFAADAKNLGEAHENFTCADCHQTDTPKKRPAVDACFKCHGSYDALAAQTDGFSPNPHQSHQGELRCSQCHKQPHAKDTLYCNQCHDLQIYKFN